MARRTADGETADEVTIDYVRRLERRVNDLEGHAAGHAHGSSPNLDGGKPDSDYGGIDAVDAGGV